MRRLIVEDFTCGTSRSTDVNTNIPFTEEFAKAKTIQRANVVIGAYTNENIKEINKLKLNKQDKLTAGDNITISDENVISSENTTYTAGSNVEITDENVINVDDMRYDDTEIKGDISDIESALSGKQDSLVAGSNITIDSETNTISATNTTYTAGANVTISPTNEISATDTTYTAGAGINIDSDNVISATSSSPTWGNITGTLSNQADLNNALNGKQATLTAGSNISISPTNEISATDTKYTAGTGISISGSNVISNNIFIKKINNNTGTSITLSESIQNFNFLLVLGGANNGENANNSVIIPVPYITVGGTRSWALGSWQTGSVNYQLEFTFPTNTSINAAAQVSIWSSPKITHVYGIKITTS